MAPVNQITFGKDEKVLCFHHELLYEAKVLDFKHTDEKDKKSPMQYRVHYKGWKNTYVKLKFLFSCTTLIVKEKLLLSTIHSFTSLVYSTPLKHQPPPFFI